MAILENRHKHQELSDQMRHVEDCIKLLDPDCNLAGIVVKRRKTEQVVQCGTLYRHRRAIDVSRTATEPMTALR